MEQQHQTVPGLVYGAGVLGCNSESSAPVSSAKLFYYHPRAYIVTKAKERVRKLKDITVKKHIYPYTNFPNVFHLPVTCESKTMDVA